VISRYVLFCMSGGMRFVRLVRAMVGLMESDSCLL